MESVGYLRPMRRTVAAVAFAASLTIAFVGCGSDSATSDTSSSPGGSSATTEVDPTTGTTLAVQKTTLDNMVDPPGAPGRTLTLMKYDIAPGAKLSPHIHPGLQMAHIDSGTLTYTVVSGTAQVRRAGSTVDEPITGPTTTELNAGDAVIELGDMVHFGENNGDVPVLITATLLTENGHDLAETVTTTTTP